MDQIDVHTSSSVNGDHDMVVSAPQATPIPSGLGVPTRRAHPLAGRQNSSARVLLISLGGPGAEKQEQPKEQQAWPTGAALSDLY